MRIVIDARKLGDYGIGSYIEGIGPACARLAPKHTFMFIARPPTADPETAPGTTTTGRAAGRPGGEGDAGSRHGRPVQGPNVRWYTNPSGDYGLRELVSLSRQARRLRADLFHAPHYVLPVAVGCPAVVTVHDCIHLRFPGLLPSRTALVYARIMLWRAVRTARVVVTVSQATRSDLVDLVGADARKIEVIPSACDSFFLENAPQQELETTRDRFGLDRPFLLWVGNLKRHKNVGALLGAFSRICERREDLDLVLAGSAPGARLAATLQELGIASRVHLPGFVSKRDLRALYRLAEVFVFPSLYEGFGLPALEAMASATPVVASDRGSLPEVVGEAGVLVDPDDVQGIASAIERVLDDPVLREELVNRGRERATERSWADAARQLLAVYDRVLP